MSIDEPLPADPSRELAATLWHYTCDHGHDAILNDGGTLRPNLRAPVPLLWLTDLLEPARDALGLTSRILDCDRTEHRYRIDNPVDVLPWSAVRLRYRPTLVAGLETAPGAQPEHWYVTTTPQHAILHEFA
jgi:hypothetical protein